MQTWSPWTWRPKSICTCVCVHALMCIYVNLFCVCLYLNYWYCSVCLCLSSNWFYKAKTRSDCMIYCVSAFSSFCNIGLPDSTLDFLCAVIECVWMCMCNEMNENTNQHYFVFNLLMLSLCRRDSYICKFRQLGLRNTHRGPTINVKGHQMIEMHKNKIKFFFFFWVTFPYYVLSLFFVVK